ncbi:unnamed protein product [Victoria cruziana]
MATSVALLADGVYGHASHRKVFSRFCVVGGILESSFSDKGRNKRLRTRTVVSREPIGVAADSVIKKQETVVPKVVERRNSETGAVSSGTKLLTDDTLDKTDSLKDYLGLSKDLVRSDGGPLRWFCPVECGAPVKDVPPLLFLPGIDGTGLGLISHHRALGRMFEVRCMHIPVFDRTPLEGDSVKMALVDAEDQLSLLDSINQLSEYLVSLLPHLSVLADIIPKETLLWKLKLLKSASSYTNSRLHAVKADVLVLASGNDKLLPSRDEAERLWHKLPNCKVRYVKDSGHMLLLEYGIHLATIIKSTIYRRSTTLDYVMDYVPPTLSEFRRFYDGDCGWIQQAISPVMLSTLKDGSIVRSLAGIPEKGPVLLVGYHMLMGLETFALVGEFLRQKNILLRGLAHPILFSRKLENARREPFPMDCTRFFGAVPVTPTNFFRLLSMKSFVLLYPGGMRETRHRKGEAYKLFWPERAEFVRMAARFKATIVPFAAVGEDDVAELVLDYNDQMSFPITRHWIEEFNRDAERVRTSASAEVRNEDFHVPGILPKVPGRFYYFFGKPVETSPDLVDKDEAHSLYLHIKSDVERMLAYLTKKREEDTYRSVIQRYIFQATWGSDREIPTFEL